MSLLSNEKLVIDILGWIGAAILILAYLMVSHGRWSGSSIKFNGCNVGASLLVGINAFYHGASPSVGINVIWMVIGLNAVRLARSK